MNIILYSYEYPPFGSGVGNAIQNLITEFSTIKNLEIDFITSSVNGKFSINKIYASITFHKLNIGKRSTQNFQNQTAFHMILFSLLAYFYTWKLILKKKYDLAHFFGYPGGLVPLLFRWKMKYIVSLRGVDVPGYKTRFNIWYFIYKPITRLIWKHASFVIANSNNLASLAKRTYPHLKPIIIPNAVNSLKFRTCSLDKKYKTFTITAGGTNIKQVKGLQYLILGFVKFNKEHSNSRLVLMGSGNFQTKLKQIATSLSLTNSIKFIGHKSHSWIENNLCRFHVFCLPSINEGMSNSLLEGMAAGLPIISTPTGDAADLIQKCGYIINKKNSEQIYHCLKKLYLNQNLITQMGKISRKKAEKMKWNNVASKYHHIYNKTILSK